MTFRYNFIGRGGRGFIGRRGRGFVGDPFDDFALPRIAVNRRKLRSTRMSTSTNASASNSGGLREAMSCDVCSEVYERTLRTPLVLPCGHTFCRACLTALKKTGRFSCPSCRAVHNNVQEEALTVNFSLLNILPFCSDFTYDQCNTHGDDLRYWCCTCDFPLCSLCLYSGHPQGHSIKLAQSFVQEKKLELIEKIKLFFGNIEDQKKELKSCFNDLDVHMKDLFRKNAYLEDKLTALTDLLHDTQKAGDIASIKYFEKNVKDFQSKEKDVLSGTFVSKEKCKEPSDIPASKEGKDKKSSGNDGSKNGKAKDSQSAGATAATESPEQQSSGQSSQNEETKDAQRAVINFREGRLLLHSLAPPAPTGLSFQVPSEVFLELSVGDRCLGHVYISLWCHLCRAQQFLALCMGTMGPSLLGTKATDRVGSILRFRYVVDGNSKTRSQPLLTNLEWGGHYAKPETEGYVVAVEFMENPEVQRALPNRQMHPFAMEVQSNIFIQQVPPPLSQGNPPVSQGNRANSVAFGICTQSNIGVTQQAPFGKVVSGLEVMQAAFQHNPITEITISHCGLVLPGLSL